MPDRHVEHMPLDKVPTATRNAKEHEQPAIASAIRTWGFIDPLVLDERTGRLIAGHGRLEALTAMAAAGENPPDGVTVEDGTWRVPVVRGWSSRSDTDADAAALALNRMTEVGGWDDAVLAEILTDVAADSADLLTATGFDPEHLEDLLGTLREDEGDEGSGSGHGDPDDGVFAPEIRITVDTELFDRWYTALNRYDGRNDAEKLAALLTELDAYATAREVRAEDSEDAEDTG